MLAHLICEYPDRVCSGIECESSKIAKDLAQFLNANGKRCTAVGNDVVLSGPEDFDAVKAVCDQFFQ